MSADWWARKLGQPAPRPPGVQLPPPPVLPPLSAPVQPQQPAGSPNTQVTGENIVDAAAAWQGGLGTRTETTPCPACGGGLYFSRANVGPSQAPRCYSCGYNSRFPQQGAGPA